jgi:hypothetical protein
MYERAVVARGELEYLGQAGSAARRHRPTPRPRRSPMAVNVQRGSLKPRQISLDRVPELEGFLRGFRCPARRRRDRPAAHFELTSSGDTRTGNFVAPKDKRLDKRIDAIEVDGGGDTARCSHHRADGDVSILLVEQLAAAGLPDPLIRKSVERICRDGVATP